MQLGRFDAHGDSSSQREVIDLEDVDDQGIHNHTGGWAERRSKYIACPLNCLCQLILRTIVNQLYMYQAITDVHGCGNG